jgi:hypothetical protein
LKTDGSPEKGRDVTAALTSGQGRQAAGNRHNYRLVAGFGLALQPGMHRL